MAIILFTQQAQAQAQQDNKSEATTYEEFVEKATGPLNLRGRYIVDENGLKIKAESFLNGMLHDELTLTPATRYQNESETFVSPLTRGRHTGWVFGNVFLSVNTMVGLITPGFQLPEYRTVRVVPRPTGQVGDEMWIVGPWAERNKLQLYVTDGSSVESLEDWMMRKLKALQ
jgi:hypothetical protein